MAWEKYMKVINFVLILITAILTVFNFHILRELKCFFHLRKEKSCNIEGYWKQSKPCKEECDDKCSPKRDCSPRRRHGGGGGGGGGNDCN